MDAAKRMKRKIDPKSKRCPLCKHRFPIVMLRKHLYRTHTNDRNLLELEKLFEKAIRRSCTEKIASIGSLEDPMKIRGVHSKPAPVAPGRDEQKKNPLASKGKPGVGKPHDYKNKAPSQSTFRYQNGLKKGLLLRAKMQMKNSKGTLPSISTASPLDDLPKIVEDNHIWESRNLRTWDKYYSSYMYPNHQYKLVTMDEVNNLFNPNRKTLVVEKQVTSDAKGNINPNRKTLAAEEQIPSDTKQKEAVSDSGKGSTAFTAVKKLSTPKLATPKSSSPPKLATPKSPSPPILATPKSPSPKPEIIVKTRDDLSDMDLHTSEDEEVVEIKRVEKRFGYQPDCEDISSDEEWA